MSSELREQFLQPKLTLPQLDALMNAFVAAVAAGQDKQQGWPRSAYGVSKAGVTALTRLQARDGPDKSVLVNSCWSPTHLASTQNGIAPPSPFAPPSARLQPARVPAACARYAVLVG